MKHKKSTGIILGDIVGIFSNKIAFIAIFITLNCKILNATDFRLPGGDLIYGLDDRQEIENYNDETIREHAKAVAMRVSKKRLSRDRENPDRIVFPLIKLKKALSNLCEDEKFSDQIALGNCSGFLIGPKTLVTAGHCMNSLKECSDNKWVFGYKEGVVDFTQDQVYSCAKIVKQKYIYSKTEVSDYAVIELDREVKNTKPLKFRRLGLTPLHTALVVVGHPMGLPMKATDGGEVNLMNDVERENIIQSFFLKRNYFTANLDAYAGNSGSPVFNKKTKKVEGILIQGAEDFEYNEEKECLQSKHLSNSPLETYEKVMRINKIPGI